MQQLIFGTAYYPEYLPYDRMEQDIGMMKAAGMNVVRIAESTWSTLEPREGIFNFTYIDKLLDLLVKFDMMAIIGTPTYAIPSWLEKLDGSIMVTTKTGQARYGHRQLMDITNRTFLAHAKKVIRKLLEHTADNDRVIGFQIDNETKHYGVAGEHVQSLFKEYLQKKFVTTKRLNQTFGLAYWSNSIDEWDDLPDMRGCINGGLAAEFERFQRSVAADYIRWQADIVAEYKRPDQFVTHNLDFEWKKFGADIAQDGYSYGVQPDMDHSVASRYLTLAGTDIYHPTQDKLTGAETAFGGDEIRSLKHKPYLVLECQAQAFKTWTPYPGQLRLHAYSHLASGAAGLLYWNWHSIHNGYETYWRGVLSHDFEPNPCYQEAKQFGEEWHGLGAEKLCIKKQNQVALIVDNHSLTAFKWFPIDRDLSYNDVVRWMYDSLYEMNIECDVVFAEDLDVSSYQMLITPALYSVSEELIQKLNNFVNQGGILVSSFKSFVADRHLTVFPDRQPHIMNACFGMSYNQFTDSGHVTVNGCEVKYFAELLKVETAEVIASYEHKYWGKYAAVTRNTYGSGSAYYIGCYTEKDILKDIYRSALSDAGIDLPGMKFQWPVTIRSGRNNDGDVIHYLLNYSSEMRWIECPFVKVKELLGGREYDLGARIDIDEWGVLVLEEIAHNHGGGKDEC